MEHGFLEKINMPEEAFPLLNDVPEAGSLCPMLCTDDYDRAAHALREMLGDDPRGMKILSVMLRAAQITQEKYRVKGIPDAVFYDTMGFFSRCVREYRESYGCYGFSSWEWGGRQLALKLFRLGALEFEFVRDENGKRSVSVHIPSDADLSESSVNDSFGRARAFAAKFYPEFEGAQFGCCSWLLSPALRELLPHDSRILRFAARFELSAVFPEREDYKLWVFKDPSLPPERFPERTSLQRNMKKYVLMGGKIGTAAGVIR